MPSQATKFLSIVGVLSALLLLHLSLARASEPFFSNDETRHTMTGVFMADAMTDMPLSLQNPKSYALRYYGQYPAVGLLTWPPFFYIVEGCAMILFGPHFWVGRLCVALFALLALLGVYRLACLQSGHWTAVLAMLLVGMSPLVFVFSQRVMLELPCFALVVWSIWCFERFLQQQRRGLAWSACTLAALAMLTRYDAAFLPAYFIVRLVQLRWFSVLLKREVLLGIGTFALLAVPYYLLAMKLYASGFETGTDPKSLARSTWERWLYYPGTLPLQAGWTVALAVPVALLSAMVVRSFWSSWPLALMVVVFGFFTAQSEQEARHAIYWLPALAVLITQALDQLWQARWKWLTVALVVVLILGSVREVTLQAYRSVQGYNDAAEWIMQHRQTDRPVLVDGELTASMTYHIRLNDPARQLWVLRADKLLYSMFSDPSSQYQQYAKTEAEVLELLERYDPEFVWIEDPPTGFNQVPGSELLRQTLPKHPDRYEKVNTVTIHTNYDKFTDNHTALVVYRKLHRNPEAVQAWAIPVHGLGGNITVER